MDHHSEDSDVEWLQTHGVVQDTTERRNTACMKVNDYNVRVQPVQTITHRYVRRL